MSMFLTNDELRELTGCVHRALQIAELKRRRYRYEVNRVGRILVARCHVERRLDGDRQHSDNSSPAPNFAVIRGGA